MPNSRYHIRSRNEKHAVVSVQAAVQDFLVSTEVKRLFPKTQDEYQYNLTQFALWCASHSMLQNRSDKSWQAVKADSRNSLILLHQVDDQVVHCFIEYIKATHKPSKNGAEKLSTYTLAGYVKNIKRFLNWCVLDEQYTHHVQANTVKRIKKPQLEETVIDVFSPQDLEALFRACEKEESEHLQVRDKAILALLLDSGLRATELVTLTIGNVCLDPGDAHVRVLGKGRKWGEVGIGEQARRSIQKYIRMFREPTVESETNRQRLNVSERQLTQIKKQTLQQAVVFVNRAGKCMTKSGLYQLVERLGEWAGIESVRCSPHTFRHTFAVMFWRKTHDIRTLSKLLRHSSLAVTENYLKSILQSEARRGAPSVLDEL